MSGSVAVYLVSDSEPWVERVSDEVDEVSGTFGSVEAFLDATVAGEGGIVFLGPGMTDAEVASLSEALDGTDGEWSAFRGGEAREGGAIDVVPVPLPASCAFSLGDLASRLRRSDEEPPALELCRVLSFVARTRHDINNPLTSALAETQLLLLDVEDAETREGLETVEAQLRRIRDLVARLQALPRPRSLEGVEGTRSGPPRGGGA